MFLRGNHQFLIEARFLINFTRLDLDRVLAIAQEFVHDGHVVTQKVPKGDDASSRQLINLLG